MTLDGTPKTWVADFVHGTDGFGNMKYQTVQVQPHSMLHLLHRPGNATQGATCQISRRPITSISYLQGKRWHGSAAEFIVQVVSEHPGQVTILALGPLTNVAVAMQLDSSLAENAVGFLTNILFTCHNLGIMISKDIEITYLIAANIVQQHVYNTLQSYMYCIENIICLNVQAEIVVLGGAFFVNGNVNPAGKF